VFKPVERSRAFERVVQQIESAIYAGHLKPGDHLPSERALVEEFQVGRSTVREALRILESMELLRTQPGSPNGPQVSASNTARLRGALNGVIRVEKISLVDLVQYRMISGSAANFLAAHLRTTDQLASMSAAMHEMESSPPDDIDRFVQNDARFHQVILDAAGNSFLEVVTSAITGVIVDEMTNAIKSSTDSAETRAAFLKLHRELYAAIQSGDGALASDLAKNSLFYVYAPLLEKEDQDKLRLLLTPTLAEWSG